MFTKLETYVPRFNPMEMNWHFGRKYRINI
jgi:hypothetical protein